MAALLGRLKGFSSLRLTHHPLPESLGWTLNHFLVSNRHFMEFELQRSTIGTFLHTETAPDPENENK